MERVKISSCRQDQDILRGSFYREKESLRGPYPKDQDSLREFNVTEQDTLRGPYFKDQDTLKVSKCGCVPQISLVYEDVGKGVPRWTKRIPLLGPLWCVSGATGTKLRRRDNAVYRSNSFKYERKSPNIGLRLKTLDKPQQQLQLQQHQLNQLKDVKLRKPVQPAQPELQQDLRINLNYSDPQDAAELNGNFNQGFQQDEESVPLTKVRVGGEIYYCRPYQPFHTQLRYNFSDLLESGVDNESEYEEMPNSPARNNNSREHDCSACVTVISVCPSPARAGHCSSASCNQKVVVDPSVPCSYKGKPTSAKPVWTEPPYENLYFHKVTINVPDKKGEDSGEKQINIQRNPPLKKSKVPLKYQGIKRVKSRNRSEDQHEKTGYSQKEVWNWLYLEESGETGLEPSHPCVDPTGACVNSTYSCVDTSLSCTDPYSDYYSPGTTDKSVSIQFSPTEFLSATTRLAHLDLEGFERFVGNTFDRALAGARGGRTKSSDLIESSSAEESNPLEGLVVLEPSSLDSSPTSQCERDTDTYVWRDSCRVRAVCESCLKSGVSSCSSALSSLESGGSRETNTSRDTTTSRDSDQGSEMSRRETNRVREQGMSKDGNREKVSLQSQEHYIKMTGKTRSHLSKFSTSNPHFSSKPYQTLEVNVQEKCGGIPGGIPLEISRNDLELVDPSIQLHQQEWYHGNVSRTEAESALRLEPPGSYLVRNCESANKDYSLSLKSRHGFMHMRIQQTNGNQYILGQFSRPFTSIPHMINYYTINRLPIKGAEHVSLKKPLCEQLL